MEQFGANVWLVEEMYEQYRADPSSVSESWQEFFADYSTPALPEPARRGGAAGAGPAGRAADRGPAPSAPAATAGRRADGRRAGRAGKLILGSGAMIVTNMEQSLGVPTATSFRDVPAKLLEVNRRVINGYLGRKGAGKVSFTHLIGYAVVRAIADDVPAMNNTFVEGADGKPRLAPATSTSTWAWPSTWPSPTAPARLVVPVLRDADDARLRRLPRRLRGPHPQGPHRQADASPTSPGATMTLTNPGTIGTVQSVPRLMPGQGVIVGVGTIDYPAEYQAADERALGELGVSKVVTVTLHLRPPHHPGRRVGLFLKPCTSGCSASTASTTTSSARSACRTRRCSGAGTSARSTARTPLLQKQMQVSTLIRAHRVRGHLIADLDPLAWKEPKMHDELDPATYGLTIWDLDREFLTGGVAGTDRMPLGDLLHVLRDAYCRTIGIEYMHIQDTDEQRWIQEQVEGVKSSLHRRGPALLLEPAERGRGLREVPRHEVRRHEALRARRAPSSLIPILDTVLGRGGRRRARRRRARHVPPRPAERAGQHRRQELRPDLPRVRGLRRPHVGPGLGRREVPPRRGRASTSAAPATTSRSSWPPTRPTSRRSTPSCSAWCGPARTPSTSPTRSRSCRCCSTATPRSPARAWWPSAST